MIKIILSIVLTAVACVAVLAGAAYRLDLLHYAASAPRSEAAGPTEDQALFRDLLAAGVLKRRPDGGLDRVPPDFLLLQKIADKHDDSEAARRTRNEQSRLLKALDYSAVGSIVRKQVELWNETRRIVAIRDNRPRPEGDVANGWLAFNQQGRPLPPGDMVPEVFGFIHDGKLQPGFSDWRTVPAAQGPVLFRTEITVDKPMTLTVQVIGKPETVPNGARVDERVGELPWPCPEESKAYVVSVPLRQSSMPVKLEIAAARTTNCSPRIFGLAIGLLPDQNGDYTVYQWRPVKRSRPAGKFAIRTADGVYLTDEGGSGKPTAATHKLGLLPIVGTGAGDSFSLGGLLGGTRLPPEGLEVRLTIDSRLQEATQRAVEWGIDRFGKDRYVNERKSGLVVLNAETGAILAVGNSPGVPLGVHPWDIASFAATYPLRDPSSVIAWEVIDKHNTPGSTFKPVTALALMTADGAPRQTIDRLIAGVSPFELIQEAGLSPGTSAYAPGAGSRSIPNFGGAAIGRYFGRNTRSADICKVPQFADPNFGLRQAVQFSINVWFARMAVMMERPLVDAFIARMEKSQGDVFATPEFNLTRTARWLGIDDREREDLASNLPASAGLRRFTGDSADILYAQRARSALAQLEFKKSDRGVQNLLLWTIALNGIGQTVSASPLHMSQVAAAIAGGKRVRAHLLSEWGGQKLPPPPTEPLKVDPKLFAQLRNGMKSVPEVGTAGGVFPGERRCHVYGKTGTAEIDKAKAYNTGWFIGWREPIADDPRRLAFACMATHATGRLRFGGSACAPVVNRILETIESKGNDKDKDNKGG